MDNKDSPLEPIRSLKPAVSRLSPLWRVNASTAGVCSEAAASDTLGSKTKETLKRLLVPKTNVFEHVALKREVLHQDVLDSADGWRRRVPDTLSWVRLASIPFLILLSYLRMRMLFLAVFTPIMLTDSLDGFLARRWRVSSPRGSFLDSLADELMVYGSLVMLHFLLPELLWTYRWPIASLVGLSMGTRIITTLKRKNFTFVHLYTGKAAATTFQVMIIATVLLQRANFLVSLYFLLAGIAITEEFCLKWWSDRVDPDTKSAFFALRKSTPKKG